ncbi:MAG: 3-deoxy-7-phosphoheptulonate synthase [Spirochaetes bacterium]|nr:3-deoxy-7-phosphoheptulonate synthase [Spirochaetota bacterium]
MKEEVIGKKYLIRKLNFIDTYKYFLNNKKNIIIAGPCSLENREQIFKTIDFLLKNGIHFIRVFPYKVRTSPYDFDGLKDSGIEIIKDIKLNFPQIKIVSEVYSEIQVEKLTNLTDVFQIGTRFMYHRELIAMLGKHNKPLILKRGFASTIKEWLLSAEFYLKEGGDKIILCERGIRTFENSVRNSFDITSIIAIREFSNIPVIVDPSHILGKRKGIDKIIIASLFAGFNGFIVEIHPYPKNALSDRKQQLDFLEFENLLNKLKNYNLI